MAKKPAANNQGASTPDEYPQTPPRDLHPTSDIRFVMVELGNFGSKIDRLIADVATQSSKIGDLERAVDRVKTGAIVAASILSVTAFVFWWVLGDRITTAVHKGLFEQPVAAAEASGGTQN